ncbi:hypothetical protein GUF71_22635, partial [Xanthomonas citri pv. citri]|nr:hypothetical protein [Xanthomonas citri pv. citri]
MGALALGQIANAKNYMSFNFTSAQNAWVGQKISSVLTLANGKATFSFWMRAGVAGKKAGVRLAQIFGTGGSPSAAVNTEHPTIIN